MANEEEIFVQVWDQKWGKYPAPQKIANKGAVRRLSVTAMLDKTMPVDAEAGGKLIDGIFTDLKALLKDGAMFWSPAPGLVDVFYPDLVPHAADLSHSVLRSAVERRVQDVVGGAGDTRGQGRRIEWDEFQRVCQRAKARPEQIQTIDVSELILGKSDPSAHLSRRAWKLVETVMDEFLVRGYGARHAGNQIVLFFPGLSVSLAQLKRRSMAAEIEQLVKESVDLAEDDLPDAAAGSSQTRASKAATPAVSSEDAKEIAQLNQAFAHLASAANQHRDEAGTGEPDTVSFSPVPVWRAHNQTLVGHLLDPDHSLANVLDPDVVDLASLAQAQTDVHEGIKANSPYLVLARVQWRTLEKLKTRSRYLEQALQMSEEMRRYLVLSLVGIPPDLMAGRVEERINELRRCCRTISCEVELDRRGFDQFRGLPIHAVGARLVADGTPEREIMASMTGFLDALAPFQFRSFVDDVATKSLAIAALTAGFDYLSGSAIVDGQGRIQGVRAFSISDLYEPIAE